MNLDVIIIGAGLGSRMKSSKPKAMHSVGSFSMIEHLIHKAYELNAVNIVSVIGNEMQDLEVLIAHKSQIAHQLKRDGSATAVLSAKDLLLQSKSDVTLILYTDTPLVDLVTLEKLIQYVYDEVDLGVVSFVETTPNAYGKLLVNNNNYVENIVENAEATKDQRDITLCNSGIMAFRTSKIWEIIGQIQNNNTKQEYYLTDAIGIANKIGYKCGHIMGDKNNLMGANNKEELEHLEHHFQKTQRENFLQQGVQLIDKSSVYFALDTKIGKDVIIYPNVFIGENVTIGDNVTIYPFSMIVGTSIGNNSQIGPYARLRPNTVLQDNTHIGNFVEIKASNIGDNTKINHLSYIGDATIGESTNVGAGTITCNYDGKNKHKTQIGNNAFIGSNSSLVAPLVIGNNATIGAGSVITNNVDDMSLGIARASQKNINNYKKKS